MITGLLLMASGFLVLLWLVIRPKKSKPKSKSNPYIDLHKCQMQNDDDYVEYLRWAHKHAYGTPIPKMVSKSEFEAVKKIKETYENRRDI